MKPYELTYIISSAENSENAEALKKDMETFIQSKGGVILKSSKTVPQSLAYTIKKQSSGYFATLEFQIEEKEIKELKEKLEKESKILRHFLIIKKPIKQMKARRVRKTPLVEKFVTESKSAIMGVFKKKDHHEADKVELKDIDKKLDEILSE